MKNLIYTGLHYPSFQVPKKVDFLCNKGIIQVECGASFFLALRDNGSVYSWGKSEHYSLGQGSVQYIGAPQRILGLIEKNVTSIAVGKCIDSAIDSFFDLKFSLLNV